MFLSIQLIPGLIFATADIKAKIRPGVEAKGTLAWTGVHLVRVTGHYHTFTHTHTHIPDRPQEHVHLLL